MTTAATPNFVTNQSIRAIRVKKAPLYSDPGVEGGLSLKRGLSLESVSQLDHKFNQKSMFLTPQAKKIAPAGPKYNFLSIST